MTFSIVTLSHNQAEFLPSSMTSVFAQREGGLSVEYIVVDPGSTDQSRQLISAAADRIDCLILEPDRGPADGLNKGFARSSGEILGFINADDCLESRALGRVNAYFTANPDIEVVTGVLRIIDRRGTPRRRVRVPTPFSAKRFALGLTTVLQQSTFFRRSAWERTRGFEIENRTSWDSELFVDMDLAGARFGTVNSILGQFRIHPTSITSRAASRSSGAEHDLALQMGVDMQRIRLKALGGADAPHVPGLLAARRLAYRARPTKRFKEVTHLGLVG